MLIPSGVARGEHPGARAPPFGFVKFWGAPHGGGKRGGERKRKKRGKNKNKNKKRKKKREKKEKKKEKKEKFLKGLVPSKSLPVTDPKNCQLLQ